MHADLFDEQAEKLFCFLGAFVGEDVVDLVSEAGEGCRVWRRMRLCGRPVPRGRPPVRGAPPGAFMVAKDAFLAERG